MTEAVKIGRFGEDNLLNSKGEFNRSRITRLTLGEVANKQEENTDKIEEGLKVENDAEGRKREYRRKPASTEEKTTCMGRKEDDQEGRLMEKPVKKVGEEFERLRAGC